MKQWLYGVGAAMALTACTPGVSMQPPLAGTEHVAVVKVADMARSLQAVAANWTAADVDHYVVTLEVYTEAVFAPVQYRVLRDSGSFGPLSPARSTSVTPGNTATFTRLTDGKLYRASVVAVGGEDDLTVISHPAYANFDFRETEAPNTLEAAANPVFLPVAFDGTFTVTPEAPATTGGWADPADAEIIATSTPDIVATSAL